MHGLYFEDLEVGQSACFGKTITDAEIAAFAGVSGDTNPVHLHDEFAASTPFKTRIAHGMLGASYISTLIGTRLPGPGCIYVSQNLRFKAPVRVGDTLTAFVTIEELIPEKKFIKMKTQCLVGDKVVIDGEATIMVPTKG
ncbi:MAG: MaoC family dehydratase [Rhodobacterales bacterium]|nr:MaoC family dehydratase [Rhodobacterales bacterium]